MWSYTHKSRFLDPTVVIRTFEREDDKLNFVQRPGQKLETDTVTLHVIPARATRPPRPAAIRKNIQHSSSILSDIFLLVPKSLASWAWHEN